MSGKQAKANRRKELQGIAAALEGQALWHGGPNGLRVGTVLQSLSRLLQVPSDVRLTHPWFNDLDHSQVYVTADRVLARDYAARWDLRGAAAMAVSVTPDGTLPATNPWRAAARTSGGSLYRVEPMGPMTRDPDYPPGISFKVPEARVIAIEEADIPYSQKSSLEVLHYQTWEEGDRRYDDEGYALTNIQMRQRGITDADLRPMGYAPEADEVLAYANRLLAKRLRESN